MRVFALAALMLMALMPAAAPDDLSAGWRFAPGSPAEGLSAPASGAPVSQNVVALPHRVLLPNTPLWYVRDIDLPQGGSLEVSADDGAQVFVGGRLLPQQRRWYRLPDEIGGRQTVTIRVLNNAMAGGLRQVSLHAAGDLPPSIEGAPSLADVVPHPESAAFAARMPGPGQPCRFTAWGDSQGGWSTFDTLITRMTADRMDLSIGAGDLVNDGADPGAWRGLAAALGRLAPHAAIVPVIGNHDYDGFANDLVPALYLRAFAPPERRTYTAWTCGPVRFAAIDINASFPVGAPPGSAQLAWLQREAQSPAWRNAGWRVLVVHQPPWSKSWPGYDGDAAVRAIVEPLATRHQLDAVIAGHSHAYERTTQAVAGRPVTLVITGGAGGSLEPAESEKLSTPGWPIAVRHHFVRGVVTAQQFDLTAVGMDGQIFDRVSLTRTP